MALFQFDDVPRFYLLGCYYDCRMVCWMLLIEEDDSSRCYLCRESYYFVHCWELEGGVVGCCLDSEMSEEKKTEV